LLKARFSYSRARVAEGLKAWEAANSRPAVTVAQVADHIEHVVRVAGHDHVGIGGDLDGIPFGVERLDSADGYPLLLAELIRRGWSDGNLAKLAGGNILRALRGAEATAASMKDVSPSMAVLEKPAATP
jgi:membrane dipeptidase